MKFACFWPTLYNVHIDFFVPFHVLSDVRNIIFITKCRTHIFLFLYLIVENIVQYKRFSSFLSQFLHVSGDCCQNTDGSDFWYLPRSLQVSSSLFRSLQGSPHICLSLFTPPISVQVFTYLSRSFQVSPGLSRSPMSVQEFSGLSKSVQVSLSLYVGVSRSVQVSRPIQPGLFIRCLRQKKTVTRDPAVKLHYKTN